MTETGGAGECAAGRSGQPDGTGKRCRAGEGATSRTRRKGEQTGAGAEREADTLMAGGNALELHGPIAGAEKAARNMRPPFWSFGCGKLFPVRRERHALLHLLMLPFGDIAGGKRSRCRLTRHDGGQRGASSGRGMEFGRAERRRCAPVFIPQFLLSAVSAGNAFSPPATERDGWRQRGAFFDNMCGGR